MKLQYKQGVPMSLPHDGADCIGHLSLLLLHLTFHDIIQETGHGPAKARQA
ncbi:hypothetical protein AMTR_s00115p00126440 [Amborella trichopoda]|uniref:Uncharacterized protein n=1 Tax=Amborella trichopoda TaxID=13333 RepID=W1NQW1_AMBTC|nr:hypothetical protein AMTR_s00115p00126440 [Amborella trichopoda]